MFFLLAGHENNEGLGLYILTMLRSCCTVIRLCYLCLYSSFHASSAAVLFVFS